MSDYLSQIRKDPDWNPANSMRWFVQNIPKLRADPRVMLGQGEKRAVIANVIKPGSLYLYKYDPKYKDVLPMWDQFPIVFPFSVDVKGFTGLNMHYLTPNQRLQLFSNLMTLRQARPTTAIKTKQDALRWGDRIQNISWRLIKGLARVKEAEKAVHRYLWPHVRTKFMMMNPADWKIAILLPIANFHYNKK